MRYALRHVRQRRKGYPWKHRPDRVLLVLTGEYRWHVQGRISSLPQTTPSRMHEGETA